MSKLSRLHDRVKALEAELAGIEARQDPLNRKIVDLEQQNTYLRNELNKSDGYSATLEGRLMKWEGTPASRRELKGEEDTFANYLDKERADLAMGHMTDDAIANAIFMNYDVFPSVQDMVSGKGVMPITYMTAGKERIRWLSRQMIRLNAEVETYKAAGNPKGTLEV